MSNLPGQPEDKDETIGANPGSRRSRIIVPAVAGLALVVLGAAAGAGATRLAAGHDMQTLLTPTAINTLADDSVAAVKGNVVEIFGNKFIVQDATGRALVETGPQGDDGDIVAKDETVTVQGRFDDGFLHGSVIIHADGKTEMLGPMKGPKPHGPRDFLRGL